MDSWVNTSMPARTRGERQQCGAGERERDGEGEGGQE